MNSIHGGKGNLVENLTENGADLVDAIKKLGGALDNFKLVMTKCRKDGMTDNDIRDAILADMSEEDRPQFLQIWPMFSMMLHSL